MIKIYLSGPIDQCSIPEQSEWRNIVQQVYSQYKFVNPLIHEIDILRGKTKMSDVIQIEKKEIEECDVLLAYPWKPSSGTAMEILWAHMKNDAHKSIKIVTVNEKEKYLSPWISYHSDVVVDSFFDAFQWIEENLGSK